MGDVVKIRGKIIFDPENITKKHKNQATWKYVAMVFFDNDVSRYYSWFLKKRFNLTLERPIRNSHVTFINDSFNDLSHKGEKSALEVEEIWNKVKKEWNNKLVDIYLELDPDTNSISKEEIDNWKKTGQGIDLWNIPNGKNNFHWWLRVPYDKREVLQGIRSELGLEKPYFGMHMTIGLVMDSRPSEVNDSNGLNIKETRIFHSRYLHWLKLTNRI